MIKITTLLMLLNFFMSNSQMVSFSGDYNEINKRDSLFSMGNPISGFQVQMTDSYVFAKDTFKIISHIEDGSTRSILIFQNSDYYLSISGIFERNNRDSIFPQEKLLTCKIGEILTFRVFDLDSKELNAKNILAHKSLEDMLAESYLNKIALDNNDIHVGDVTNSNVNVRYSRDSTFVYVYGNKYTDQTELKIADIHNPSNRLGVYISTQKRICYISGFDFLDLEEFFYCEKDLSSFSSSFAKTFKFDILETDAYFEKLEKITRKIQAKRLKIYRREAIKLNNPFRGEKIY